MKKTLIYISIISVVLLFYIGCSRPKQEKTINDFFNGMEMSNEELFLSSLDSESLQIWKEMNFQFSYFSEEEYTWVIEKIENQDSKNAKAFMRISYDEREEYVELGLIKEKNNWKINYKDKIIEHLCLFTFICNENLRSINTIVRNYSTDHKGHYPQNLKVLFKLGYIESLPKCPLCGEDYIYKIDNWDSTKYELFCPCAEKNQAYLEEIKKGKNLNTNPEKE